MAAEGEEVCNPCRPTQAGQAALLLADFERCRVNAQHVEALEALLDRVQNGPPLGEGDGTIDDGKFVKLRDLWRAA